MPLSTSPEGPTGLQTWSQFLAHSLATRLDSETFESYVRIISAKHSLPASTICELFLKPQPDNDRSIDPRVPLYLQVMLQADLVTIPSVLRSLQRYSTFGADAGAAQDIKQERKRWRSSYPAEDVLFYRLAKYVSGGKPPAPRNAAEAVELLHIAELWMETVTIAGHSSQELLILGHGNRAQEIANTTMALGTLVESIINNQQFLNALSQGSAPKGTGKKLSVTLANFLPFLEQSSAQSAARLDIFRTQTLVTIEPVDKKDIAASKEIDEMLGEGIELGIESVVAVDLPTMNSRAGLYIYLNSLLVGRPLIDDHAILGYLQNRFQGDVQTTTIDLILASFDILANATFRNEKEQTTTLFRSFLVNKVPLLIAALSTSFYPPLTAEYCITEALSHVDTNAFPTFSTMFAESNNSLFSDPIRQDFCFACCLHGLLEESSIATLLGDIPIQNLPPGGRFTKENLLRQCLNDPEKADTLIDELEILDGNVGAVSQAITEFIGTLCRNKDTLSLKSICAKLARKASPLDIMLLFDKPITILQPICELLDNWLYDEDQGEYQPVYDEFGSILLLVLAFVHRYNFSPLDLGIRSSTSFTAKLLTQGHLSKVAETLTDQEQNHLGGWIKGLFDTESGGLGDELMSSCPPQDFYLLVPTLFHNIVLACSTNNLSDEALRGGLEYLLEPFLLPSLIPGITWLSSHLWESRGDVNAVIQILSALISNPASISNNAEAGKMLSSILNIIAKNLEHSLRWLQRAEPTRQDVEPLSRAVRGNLGWERRGASDHTELEAWTATPNGGLVIAVKMTINALVHWAQNPGININPANYTHRQILVALRQLGAKRLLGVIIEEVKAQTELGNGSAVMDIAVSLICAPESSSWDSNTMSAVDIMSATTAPPLQRRLTLREALKTAAEAMPKVQKTDAVHAEAVIRVYRRVEAQMVVQQPVLMVHDGLGGDGMEGLTLVAADQGMRDVLGGENDLMSGLMGGGDMGMEGIEVMDMGMSADDIFGGMDNEMGDGMF